MAVWSIVDNYTREPINSRAYTTAETRGQAWKKFNGKWKAGEPGIPSVRKLAEMIESSYWNIIEVPPNKPKELEQSELNFERQSHLF